MRILKSKNEFSQSNNNCLINVKVFIILFSFLRDSDVSSILSFSSLRSESWPSAPWTSRILRMMAAATGLMLNRQGCCFEVSPYIHSLLYIDSLRQDIRTSILSRGWRGITPDIWKDAWGQTSLSGISDGMLLRQPWNIHLGPGGRVGIDKRNYFLRLLLTIWLCFTLRPQTLQQAGQQL